MAPLLNSSWTLVPSDYFPPITVAFLSDHQAVLTGLPQNVAGFWNEGQTSESFVLLANIPVQGTTHSLCLAGAHVSGHGMGSAYCSLTETLSFTMSKNT